MRSSSPRFAARVAFAIAPALALVLALAGCKSKQPPARSLTPPTAQEAEAFGIEIAKHFAPCNTVALDRMIDTELLVSRAVASRAMRERDVEGLRRGLGTIGTRMCAELSGQAVAATYLRTQMIDGTPRPLLRFIFDAGVNYYQFELDKTADLIRAADIYLYLSGEKMSETFGSVIDMLLASPRAPTIRIVGKMKQEMHAGNYQEAYRLFQSLPADVRNSKPIRLIELQITAELTDAEYVAAMDAYEQAYPGDASLALVKIDHFLLKNQFDQVLAAIDQLDKQLGGDPYLEVMRTDAFIRLGKPDEALAAAKRGVAAEPTLEQLWWALLTVQAGTEQYADALPTLDALRDTFGAQINAELGADERFTKLAASPVFQGWLDAQQP